MTAHPVAEPAARRLLECLRQPLDPAIPVILDVRDAHAFAAGHLPGSGHLPASEWERRRSELPAREARVIVVAETPARARAAALELQAMGYARTEPLGAPLATPGNATDTSPAWPLWRPTATLVWALDRFADAIPRRRAADLASGSGRDAVFLALLGFDVEAWDRAPETLARASELAQACGVRVTPVECDLEHGRPPLPTERYALLTCFRFLDRRLHPRMIAALAPGGVLIHETYRAGQERFGKPKRAQYLLAPGELPALLPGLEILHYEERAPEGGPITARIVARKA